MRAWDRLGPASLTGISPSSPRLVPSQQGQLGIMHVAPSLDAKSALEEVLRLCEETDDLFGFEQ